MKHTHTHKLSIFTVAKVFVLGSFEKKKPAKEEKREAVSSGRQSGPGESTVSAEEEEEFQRDFGSVEESLPGCPG